MELEHIHQEEERSKRIGHMRLLSLSGISGTAVQSALVAAETESSPAPSRRTWCCSCLFKRKPAEDSRQANEELNSSFIVLTSTFSCAGSPLEGASAATARAAWSPWTASRATITRGARGLIDAPCASRLSLAPLTIAGARATAAAAAASSERKRKDLLLIIL